MNRFNQIIKAQRLRKGMLVRELAQRIGVDSALVSRYEKGERLPTEAILIKMQEALGITDRQLKKYWLAEKILEQVKPYPEAVEALSIVEETMTAYKKAAKAAMPRELKQLLAEADKLKKALRQFYPLNKAQLMRLNEYFVTHYTYESNRIEGNTLTLQETALVVNKGITISGKSVREHLEAINHAEAITYVQDIAMGKTIISEKLIKELHYLILKSIDKENAGSYRRANVRIAGSRHIPVEHFEVPLEMQKLLQYYGKEKNRLHPILLAADLHWMLAGIHPFIDGNGRTSRLLMNLILINNGYVIANLKGDISSKAAYYDALEEGHVHMNMMPFRKLVLQTVIDGLNEYLAILS